MTTGSGNPFPARGTMSMEEQVRDADILDRQITGPTVELPAVAGLTALVRLYLDEPSRGQVAFLHGRHGTGKTHTIRYALGGETGALRLYAKAQDGNFHALYQRLMSQVGRDRLRGLSRDFQAVLAGEEAGLLRPPDAGRAALLFTELLVEPGAVLEAQADELSRVTDDGQDFQRALTSLLEPAMEEAAFAWLAGREVTPTDAARLGVAGPLTEPNQCRYGLQLLTALCARVGTPVIIVMDQCERLVLGRPANLGVLHSLVERIPQEGGMLLLSGSEAVWAALPEDLRQRFGANHLETGLLSPTQATELLGVYMELVSGPGSGIEPFTPEGLRALLRLSGGNVRGFLQLAWQVFGVATAAGEQHVIDAAFTERALGTKGVGREAADRAVEAWLLDERAGHLRGWRDGEVAADYAVLSATGPRLLVAIEDAVFTPQEAAERAGLVERVRARGWPARVVQVVAGYASPDALPLLEREAHEVVVFRSERDLDRLRGTVRAVPEARPVFEGVPYPGTAPFSEREAEVFFGREGTVMALAERLAGAREPVVVTAATGAGASSLIRAGLLPALAAGALPETRWRGLVVTPGAAPLHELAVRLAALTGDLDAATILASLRERPGSARLVIRQALASMLEGGRKDAPEHGPEHGPVGGLTSRPERGPEHESEGGAADGLVLVVDQFEEVLAGRPPGDPEVATFAAVLHAIATGPEAALVVVVVSARFAARCAALPELAGQPFVLGPMGRGELRRAITGPAEVAGLALDGGLVDSVLDDLCTPRGSCAPGALPLLAMAMRTLCEQREGDDRLTLRGYAESGGIRRAAVTTAESVYRGLDDARQAVARAVLRRLAAISRDGRIVPKEALLADLRAATPGSTGDFEAVLRKLAAARVVVVDAEAVRMAHECLAEDWPRLKEWFREDRSGQILYDQLLDDAAEWAGNRHDPAFLYRGTRLASVLKAQGRWEESTELPLDDRARDFLLASGRARRRRRAVRTSALMVALVAVLVAGLNLASLTKAELQLQKARDHKASLELVEKSELVTDPALSALLAALAWRVSPTQEARAGLVRALGGPTRTASYRLRAPALAVTFDDEGKLIAAEGRGDVVQLSEVPSGRPVGKPLKGDGTLMSAAFSSDGRALAVGTKRSVLVVDLPELDPRVRLDTRGESPRSLAFSPDGRTLATGTDDGVLLWDLRRNAGSKEAAEVRSVTSVAFSKDARTLAAGVNDGTVYLKDVSADPLFTALLKFHVAPVTSVAFNPDGRSLATGSTDTTVRLWEDPSYQPLGVIHNEERRGVTSMAFDGDGRTLATGDDGGTVELWDVGQPSDLLGAACASAGRDLTPQEWAKYVPEGIERRRACPQP